MDRRWRKGAQLETWLEHGEVARAVVETTGAPVALQLVPDRPALLGDGRDALPITIRALDSAGRAVPLANDEVTLTVTGAGKSIGHGNGNPNSHEDEKGPTRRLFNGLAQLIVQSKADSGGDVVVTASAVGLVPAKLVLPVRNSAPMPSVPALLEPPTILKTWRVSPGMASRPDPRVQLAAFDMNTCGWGQPPMLESTPPEAVGTGGPFRIFRTSFTPRSNLIDGTGQLSFGLIHGKAEIWLDGELIGRKEAYEPKPLKVTLPPKLGKRELTVIVEGYGGKPAGLEGQVRVERNR